MDDAIASAGGTTINYIEGKGSDIYKLSKSTYPKIISVICISGFWKNGISVVTSDNNANEWYIYAIGGTSLKFRVYYF